MQMIQQPDQITMSTATAMKSAACAMKTSLIVPR